MKFRKPPQRPGPERDIRPFIRCLSDSRHFTTTKVGSFLLVSESETLSFDQELADNSQIRTYAQVFAVLARESGKMVTSANSIAVDRAILACFSSGDSRGLSEGQVVAQCGSFPTEVVRRRFEVLTSYGAVHKVFDRKRQTHYQAAFAPYVMLLFLARLSAQGGMAELHQLLSHQYVSVTDDDATVNDGLTATREVTDLFRILANDLAGLAANATSVLLREHAPLLWGNEKLLRRAMEIHEKILSRWPAELARPCRNLRNALAAYRDAVSAISAKLMNRAGNTQALGLLPTETWIDFARTASAPALAEVLTEFVFDAAAPWFDATDLSEATTIISRPAPTRITPPRSDDAIESSTPPREEEDLSSLIQSCEEILGGQNAVNVTMVLREPQSWTVARRLLSDMTAAHYHDDLPYVLEWSDPLAIDIDLVPGWATEGQFRRTERTAS